MTVNTLSITDGPYAGNGVATSFAYNFKIDESVEVSVYETDNLGATTLLTLTTHYTVAGLGNPAGGSITRVAGALPTGYTWNIRSNYVPTQLTAFASQGGFFPDVHEYSFDKLSYIEQQQDDLISRGLALKPYDITGDMTLPVKADRAGTVLAFDATTGLPVVGPSIASVGTVGANVANINTVAGSIANVNTVVGSIANINTVVGSIANINTVATNINTVATNIANVNTVAGSIANVNTVAAAVVNVNTVATDIANVNTVAGSIADVNTVAGSIANVNIAATNIAAIIAAPAEAAAAAASAASVVRDGSGGVAGLTLFAINMRNALNTFTSLLTNANTAARTYTFQDKTGTIAHIDDLAKVNGFRLTLTSGTPVTIADVSAATTIFCSPYKGNQIALYNGTIWNVRSTAEFSLALGTLTANLPYDVFCYDNAGTPTLEFLAWTSTTARATALVYQDGVLSKTGALTRRYLGTFYTTATTTTEDSLANRYLWNYYNRVARPMKATDATASWTYASATLRQARASTANQLNYIQGVSEDAITAHVTMNGDTTSAGQAMTSGIGIDSTSVDSALTNNGNQTFTAVATQGFTSDYVGNIAAGRHFLAWLEASNASNGTFRGSVKSGIFGSLMA